MLEESQVYNHWDIVYSCFVPDEMLSELARMEAKAIRHAHLLVEKLKSLE